ncbi:polymer-forming cytoskeletal protein [Hydrogenovibrio thermophilus]|uniref:polymer-forming cytoskeletal protein n=1 Tax=Hydrogenovibrio thermophilus TaxID=265883 RepID=UPI0021F3BF8F|nr:polymer-forming cytoskeletal protein [Hydrogenovibrio thermophilus]
MGGALHIDGHIDGIIETDYDVSIGDKGIVTGLVKAKTIVVSGTLEGKVACESIDILSSGKMLGEVVCGEMMIESGGKFIGESRELTEGGLIVSFPEDEKTKLENQAKSVVEMIKSKNAITDDIKATDAEAVSTK